VYLPTSAPAQARRGPATGSSNGRRDGTTHSTATQAGMLEGAAGGALESEWKTTTANHPEAAPRSLLVVEDDAFQRQHIVDLMAHVNAQTTAVASGEEALEALKEQKFDCVVLDLGLPGLSGWQVIDELRSHKALRSVPVLVYTARDLTRREELRLGRVTKAIVVKEVRSPERLQEEVATILNRGGSNGEALEHASNGAEPDASLAGKKVLVVDDDIRNIFALTALLERQKMEVISVDSGQEAIETLQRSADVDVALVDVMMPEMDGYTTMGMMREVPSFKERPIIALTAKAMKGDREKCIEAGASDYIAKPVNNAHLLTMLRSWLAP
jgi:CheY-like chemotaxis protein